MTSVDPLYPCRSHERSLRTFATLCPLLLTYSPYSLLFFVLSFSISCFPYSCVRLLIYSTLLSIDVLLNLISLYFPFISCISPFQFSPVTAYVQPPLPPTPPFPQMLSISRAPAVLKFALERNYLARRPGNTAARPPSYWTAGRENLKLCFQLSESDDARSVSSCLQS